MPLALLSPPADVSSYPLAVGEDPGHVMDQLGHADASFTLNVYRKAMSRRDGERERLRALVRGEVLSPTVNDALENRAEHP